MSTLIYHGKPVKFLGWSQSQEWHGGWHRRKPLTRSHGGYPGYALIRTQDGQEKSIRADLVMVTR